MSHTSTPTFLRVLFYFVPQVFVFDVGGKAWNSYDWSHVTTIATFGKYDAELMCYAHSKGARLVLKGRGFCKYVSDCLFLLSLHHT